MAARGIYRAKQEFFNNIAPKQPLVPDLSTVALKIRLYQLIRRSLPNAIIAILLFDFLSDV
jgi:hypothetical protein